MSCSEIEENGHKPDMREDQHQGVPPISSLYRALEAAMSQKNLEVDTLRQDNTVRPPTAQPDCAQTSALVRSPIQNNVPIRLDSPLATAPQFRQQTCTPCDSPSLISEQELHHRQLVSLYSSPTCYKCPYNTILVKLDLEFYPHKATRDLPYNTTSCHTTGVFSRCDTYKNHLRALHFTYPPGTRKKDRRIVPGKCKHCGKPFANVDMWLRDHVGKECGYNYH